MQDVGGRLWTQVVMSQGSRINQIVEVVDRFGIFSSCFYMPLVPVLELWTLLNFADTTNRKISNKPRKKKKEKGLAKGRYT